MRNSSQLRQIFSFYLKNLLILSRDLLLDMTPKMISFAAIMK